MRPTPFNALHAFESAARLCGYTLAAGELHVTHSAVSQQIRALESMLGVSLFERRGKPAYLQAFEQWLKEEAAAFTRKERRMLGMQASGKATA